MHRILVRTEEGFEPFSHLGESLGARNPRFFGSLLSVLPDDVRLTINLPLNAQEQQLRSLLGGIASERRDRVMSILQMQPIKPGIKWPHRLPDGRIGYPLSGRLRGFFRRLGIGSSNHSPELAVKSLYPDFSADQVASFLDELRAEHTGSAGQLPHFVKQRLRGLRDELRNLQTTLDEWITETPFSLLRTSREVAARRIHGCWRRLGNHSISLQGEFLGYSLDLDNLRVGVIPEITASFGHVAELKAWNMQLPHSHMDALLKNFTNLRSLNLGFNELQALPESIGRMTRLTEL